MILLRLKYMLVIYLFFKVKKKKERRKTSSPFTVLFLRLSEQTTTKRRSHNDSEWGPIDWIWIPPPTLTSCSGREVVVSWCFALPFSGSKFFNALLYFCTIQFFISRGLMLLVDLWFVLLALLCMITSPSLFASENGRFGDHIQGPNHYLFLYPLLHCSFLQPWPKPLVSTSNFEPFWHAYGL